MNKELLELSDAIKAQSELVDKLTANLDTLDEAEEANEKLQKMQRQYNIMKKKEAGVPVPINPQPLSNPEDSVETKFANAARRGFKNEYTGLQTTTGEDGGYLVPHEISTRIRKYREAEFNLGQLVEEKKTRFSSGEYTYEKKGKVKGFVKVPENGKIPLAAAAKYERKTYKVDKYAGIIPATSEEISDSDSNVTNLLVERLGKMSRATRNEMVLTALADGKKDTSTDTVKYEVVTSKNCDGLTKLVNITLGSAYNANAKIITNDYGKQILCEMKDANGRPLLQPDPTQPTRQIIAAGALLIQVVVVPKEIMPNVTDGGKNYAPLIVGDLKTAFTIFDKQTMSIKASDTATVGDTSAYENDLTFFRAIEREGITLNDSDAYIYARFDTEIK